MSHCKSLVVPYIVFFQEIPLASLFRKKMSAVAILDEICQKKIDIRPVFRASKPRMHIATWRIH